MWLCIGSAPERHAQNTIHDPWTAAEWWWRCRVGNPCRRWQARCMFPFKEITFRLADLRSPGPFGLPDLRSPGPSVSRTFFQLGLNRTHNITWHILVTGLFTSGSGEDDLRNYNPKDDSCQDQDWLQSSMCLEEANESLYLYTLSLPPPPNHLLPQGSNGATLRTVKNNLYSSPNKVFTHHITWQLHTGCIEKICRYNLCWKYMCIWYYVKAE